MARLKVMCARSMDATYSAAVMEGSAAKETAAALIAALTAPGTRETWTKAGFAST